MPGFVAPAAVANSSFFAAHPAKSAASCSAAAITPTMLYGKPRPVQIIPSVLPADWANMGYEVKRLEDAGVDRIQFDVMDGAVSPLVDDPLA
jgi:Ribulose-phosphate 3 epimerase family